MNDTDFFEVCYNRGHHITNPNNAVEGKIPQIYHSLAPFNPTYPTGFKFTSHTDEAKRHCMSDMFLP